VFQLSDRDIPDSGEEARLMIDQAQSCVVSRNPFHVLILSSGF
jgi:hypothetical protein